MGELKVPGVSTYIHPLSDDAILSIGLGPADEETGLGWIGVTPAFHYSMSQISPTLKKPKLSQSLLSRIQTMKAGLGHGRKRHGSTKHSNTGLQKAC